MCTYMYTAHAQLQCTCTCTLCTCIFTCIKLYAHVHFYMCAENELDI